MNPLQVYWQKCGGSYCLLETLDLTGVGRVEGVYIIWQLPSRVTVYVGEGQVADRFRSHRIDPRILGNRGDGNLRVTWAAVHHELTRFGVERYLIETFKPLVSKAHKDVTAIPVNYPV